MDFTRACALLARTPSLTAEHVNALVARCGSLEEAAEPHPDVLAEVELPRAACQFLAAPDAGAIDADLKWLRTSGAAMIPCTVPEYPPLLAQTQRAPAVLYVLGDTDVLPSSQIAIVGSRMASSGGLDTARSFAADLARFGLTITSGLALGIDAAAHEAALDAGGLTIAVCGCGLDFVYPRRNRRLAQRIREHGALVSEFPPRTEPRAPHFPQRNRIISGLAFGTLVVEAARTSGSLITARHALEQGREVFAVPGSIHNPQSQGCHMLIRSGACLVGSAAELIAELPNFLREQLLAPSPVACAGSAEKSLELDKGYEMLLDALGFEPASIDVLAARTGLPGESIASMLLILELQRRVAPHPGGRYSRLSGSVP
jgi:DNA processing protein